MLAIFVKVFWRVSFLNNREQANQCNNFGQTEEVEDLYHFICGQLHFCNDVSCGKAKMLHAPLFVTVVHGCEFLTQCSRKLSPTVYTS